MGEAPGELYVHPETKDIYLAGLRFGNIVVMVQPPRGFGDNPVGIYHDPNLAPNHHYLAAYEWIRRTPDRHGFGADAIVHVGKHGNMEWLPGKTVALGPDSGTDQSIGDLPLIYPFLVNDPGRVRRQNAAPTPPSSTTSSRPWPVLKAMVTSPD